MTNNPSNELEPEGLATDVIRSVIVSQLTRWDGWGMSLLGGSLILIHALLLTSDAAVMAVGDLAPIRDVLIGEGAVPAPSGGVDLLVRSAWTWFQGITLLIVLILALGGPDVSPPERESFHTWSEAFVALFIKALSVVVPTVVLSAGPWVILLILTLYKNTFLTPFLFGTVFLLIKLLVTLSIYQFIRTVLPRSIAGITALLFFLASHAGRFSTRIESSIPYHDVFSWIPVLLPRFDRIGPFVTSTYREAPLLFLGDISYLLIILVVSSVATLLMTVRSSPGQSEESNT